MTPPEQIIPRVAPGGTALPQKLVCCPDSVPLLNEDMNRRFLLCMISSSSRAKMQDGLHQISGRRYHGIFTHKLATFKVPSLNIAGFLVSCKTQVVRTHSKGYLFPFNLCRLVPLDIM